MPKTKEQIAAYNKEYFSRPEVIARAKIRNAERRHIRSAYKKTEAGKLAEKKYRQTEKAIKYQHEYRLKKIYGIDEAVYQQMFKGQKGKCAICDKTVLGRLHIDHCHSTQAVRGLLCGPCNRGLGLFKDDTDIMQKAIHYLKGDDVYSNHSN